LYSTWSCFPSLLARFLMFPGTFTNSVYHSIESLLIPVCDYQRASNVRRQYGLHCQTFFLSNSTILSGIQDYGVPATGPRLITTTRILFWTYVAITFSIAVLQVHLLFTGKPFNLTEYEACIDPPRLPSNAQRNRRRCNSRLSTTTPSHTLHHSKYHVSRSRYHGGSLHVQ